MTPDVDRPLDILDVLVSEHREIEDLLMYLHVGDRASSRHVTDRLIVGLVRHEVAEEVYLFPMVVDYLIDGDALARHVADHQQFQGRLRELEVLEGDDDRFPSVVQQLRTSVSLHIADEEAQLFAQLRFAVPADELVRLREGLERSERFSATYSVAKGVGMVDRLLEALGIWPTS